ncbi:MAG: DUF5683 domain-containing protein [Bacteroidetes bacterium]|nr:DUF5683 domain-containing protein [Bacteroidota bacterium]
MNHYQCLWFLFIFFLIGSQTLPAQHSLTQGGSYIEDTSRTPKTPSLPEKLDYYHREKKSGTLALLLSTVFPGAGQVYAERYYTIPIIWGCGVFFYSQFKVAHEYYKDFKQRYDQSVRLDTLNRKGILYYKETRDYYHDKRDEFALYIALTYLLNIVDAYVGATLYDFDISPQLNGVTVHYKVYLY